MTTTTTPEAGGDAPAHGERRKQWRVSTFGPASEKPYRRRTSDWLRLAVAVAIVVGTAFHVGDLTEPERALFQTFNQLPGGLNPFFTALYEIGSLWALGLIVGAALIGRRWRLARDLAVAGVGVWFVARLLGALIADEKSLGSGFNVVTRFGESPAYPAVRLAVLVAVVCAASPYLTRPTRRLGQILVLVMALSALYLGIGYPNDAFAAIVLGWGIAAAVHLVFGSPGGRPTRAQVAAALAELGVDATSVEILPVGPREGTEMTATSTASRTTGYAGLSPSRVTRLSPLLRLLSSAIRAPSRRATNHAPTPATVRSRASRHRRPISAAPTISPSSQSEPIS